MKKAAIYAEIVKHCPPVQLRPPLQLLQPVIRARAGAVEHGQLLRELTERFSPADLREAGVAQDQAGGSPELQLRPEAADPHRAFLPLATSTKSEPFDVVSDGGCLSGSGLPLVAGLKDFSNKSIASDGQLLIAFNVTDCAILLGLGLACTTASGLANLGTELTTVCSALGWRRSMLPPAKQPVKALVNTIVLVGWSPATWSAAPPAHAVIAGNKVIVSSREVADPTQARYAWTNFPDCNLYNGAGLPATPFRTAER